MVDNLWMHVSQRPFFSCIKSVFMIRYMIEAECLKRPSQYYRLCLLLCHTSFLQGLCAWYLCRSLQFMAWCSSGLGKWASPGSTFRERSAAGKDSTARWWCNNFLFAFQIHRNWAEASVTVGLVCKLSIMLMPNKFNHLPIAQSLFTALTFTDDPRTRWLKLQRTQEC